MTLPRRVPRFIDTHAHLFAKQFAPDRAEAVARAQQVLEAALLPNISLETVEPMNALADAYAGFLFPMLGIHPCEVSPDWQAQVAELEALFARRRYYGVGETGLDLYWEQASLPRQQDSLRWHAEKARALGLPLVLHAREAFRQTADVVAGAQDGRLKGVFHCWVDGAAEARRAVGMGFHLGIGGVCTYRAAAHLQDVLRAVPRECVVLETDSPYLAPMPHRGKRNEPSYVPLVAQVVAQAWGVPVAEVAQRTTQNAKALFGI